MGEVRTTWSPSVASTSSKRTAELGVAVMDEKRERLCSLVEVEGEVPRLLGNPVSGVGVATGEVDAPGPELDEHQNVDSFGPHGLDGEEVARHHELEACWA
jgi:hypothetical protein